MNQGDLSPEELALLRGVLEKNDAARKALQSLITLLEQDNDAPSQAIAKLRLVCERIGRLCADIDGRLAELERHQTRKTRITRIGDAHVEWWVLPRKGG